MSAAVCRAGSAEGPSEGAAVHTSQPNGNHDFRVRPLDPAQYLTESLVEEHNRYAEDAEPVSGPTARTPLAVHGNHAASVSGPRLPPSSPLKVRRFSSDPQGDEEGHSRRGVKSGGVSEVERGARKKGSPSPLDLRESVANGLGFLISPISNSTKLSQIPEDTGKRRSSQVESPALQGRDKEKILKLSPRQIQELTSSPKSLPLHTAPAESEFSPAGVPIKTLAKGDSASTPDVSTISVTNGGTHQLPYRKRAGSATTTSTSNAADFEGLLPFPPSSHASVSPSISPRPALSSRTVSTPHVLRRKDSTRKQNGNLANLTPQTKSTRNTPPPLQLDDSKSPLKPSAMPDPLPSPMPISIPMPPLSIPTYLQLELSSDRPSPLYIHRSATSDFPYESSRVKIERLQNFLLLPPQIEQVLWFGTLACLDAWLYSFTILPLRFLKALYILSQSWAQNLAKEFGSVSRVIFSGTGRMWRRRGNSEACSVPEAPTPTLKNSKSRSTSASGTDVHKIRSSLSTGADNDSAGQSHPETERKHRRPSGLKHRRTKSTPSALMPDHKADILKGLLVFFSCIILMYFDASRMYHSIRGQAAIKLYVIYNVLEVSFYKPLTVHYPDQFCEGLRPVVLCVGPRHLRVPVFERIVRT